MSILNESNQDSVYGLTGTPKTMFFLGLSMGVGSMAVVALVATVVFMVNGPVNVFAKGSSDVAAAVIRPTPQAIRSFHQRKKHRPQLVPA